jgi:hypothetical protein
LEDTKQQQKAATQYSEGHAHLKAGRLQEAISCFQAANNKVNGYKDADALIAAASKELARLERARKEEEKRAKQKENLTKDFGENHTSHMEITNEKNVPSTLIFWLKHQPRKIWLAALCLIILLGVGTVILRQWQTNTFPKTEHPALGLENSNVSGAISTPPSNTTSAEEQTNTNNVSQIVQNQENTNRPERVRGSNAGHPKRTRGKPNNLPDRVPSGEGGEVPGP